jgi:aminobenzoyl-glutamate utilization protein B
MKNILLRAVSAIALFSTAVSSTELSPENQAKLLAHVNDYAPRMTDVALDIWKMPELGYLETQTTALLQSELKKAGFTIQTNLAGMPTSFIASARNGDGPVIALLAEMDSLPGLSQEATPERKPIAGVISGHACGHNLFGSGAVAAAIAVKQWMQEAGIKGELRVYGTPAEEGGGGKDYMVQAGLFQDVDTVLYWHPADTNTAAQDRNLANISAKFRFHGQPAHAAAAPDRGRSALDGVEAMNFMVNAMREHVPQETRTHYVITNGGSAPNIVPEFAEVYYTVRHPDPRVVQDVFERVKKAAEGSALGTGTRMDVELIGGDYSMLPNDALGRVMDANLRKVGAPQWNDDEKAFAAKIRTTMIGNLPPVESAQAIQPYRTYGQKFASTDSGNVSWVVPLATLNIATWVPGTAAHSWQATAADGMSIGIKGAIVAAKTLALTTAQLFQSPETLAAAKSEFEKARGPGFAYKSMAGERKPPLDYRKNVTQLDPG